jgi:hypothetical protein
MSLEFYEGWQIFTYQRQTDRSRMIDALKTRFNHGDWCLSENTYGLTISYGPTGQEAKVSFQEVKYRSEIDNNVETYYVVFDAPFFGFRKSAERIHRDFCLKTLEKIPWVKQGFWLKDKARILIPRNRTLRMR